MDCTEEVEDLTPKYTPFKWTFCENFRDDDVKILKFCLYDHLQLGVLLKDNLEGEHLLNELEKVSEKVHDGPSLPALSETRIKILIEIADLVNIYKAQKCVNDYVGKYMECNEDVKNGASLKAYRKLLYKAMIESGPRETRAITAYYNTRSFDSKWDALLYLENKGSLQTRDSLLDFSRNLTGVGKKIMTDGLKKLIAPNDDGTFPVVLQKKGQTVSLSFVTKKDDTLKKLVEPREGGAIRVRYQDTSKDLVEKKEGVEWPFGYIELKKGTLSECPAPPPQNKREKKDEKGVNATSADATTAAGAGAGVTADGDDVENSPGATTGPTGKDSFAASGSGTPTGATDDEKSDVVSSSTTSGVTGVDDVDASVGPATPMLSKHESNTKKHKKTAIDL